MPPPFTGTGFAFQNGMDGVPFLTQPYVYKGDHFDYAFTPPDAGTFWYHPIAARWSRWGMA